MIVKPLRIVALGIAPLVMTLALLLPAPASADVLVNAPVHRIHLGGCIKSGVWYQSFSGGPRWAKIRVLSSHKRTLWSKKVTASAKRWKFYKYCPSRTGTYTLRYQVPAGKINFRVKVTG